MIDIILDLIEYSDDQIIVQMNGDSITDTFDLILIDTILVLVNYPSCFRMGP